MQPIIQLTSYTNAQIIAIDKEEYDIYINAFQVNEVIAQEIEEEEQEEITEEESIFENPVDRASLEFIRASKVNEMSRACRHTI